MTKRRKCLFVSLAVVAILVAAAYYQSDIIGWWRGEAKYKGRYTNSWRVELRSYEPLGVGSHGYVSWHFFRRHTKWEDWLSKVMPGKYQPIAPLSLVADGDPEAVPVLVELLSAPEPIVRMIAASGLERIGLPAREAIPALLALLEDEDELVANLSRQALHVIDPNFQE
jgi:hypothetical protein